MLIFNCVSCKKQVERKHHFSYSNLYCSNKCQKDYESQLKVDQWLKEGNWFYKNKQLPPWITRYVREKSNYTCEICSITKWNNNPIILEVDHIDGNYVNNNVNNLRAICPNCHSQTKTFKNKNKGKGRKLSSCS